MMEFRNRWGGVTCAAMIACIGWATFTAQALGQPEDCNDVFEPNDTLGASSVITLSARGHDMGRTITGCIEGESDIDHFRLTNPRGLPWRGTLRLLSTGALTHEVSVSGQTWEDGDRQLGDMVGNYFVRVRWASEAGTLPSPYDVQLDAILLSPTPSASATPTRTPAPPPHRLYYVPLAVRGR